MPLPRSRRLVIALSGLVLSAGPVWAATDELPTVAGIPVDFILFGLTLVGVALLHRHTLAIAVSGLAVITAYKLAIAGFKEGAGIGGLVAHLSHEWVVLANLCCLLMGFALLSRHFENSRVPLELPRFLPETGRAASCF